MAFVEIEPPRKVAGIGTGVRISITGRLGLRVSLADAALEAIGGGGATSFKVLIDRDPAMPRIRVALASDGRFRLGKPPLGDRWRFITLGRDTGLPMPMLKSCDCTWEAVDGQQAIDIDLPREMRATRQHQPVGQPSKSNGPRPSTVTLPGRVKERI